MEPDPDTAASASSSTGSGSNNWSRGPTCGQNCWGVANSCADNTGCKCIAEHLTSGVFTGICKLLYSALGSGRGLSEVELTATKEVNTTVFFAAADAADLNNVACPCNCSYVSHACCGSASGIVYEAPGLNLGMVEPPNSTTACNSATGDFEAISSGYNLTSRDLTERYPS